MVQITDHPSVAELQAGYRGSKDATLARHFQVIWLLAEGQSVAETARLTGFVRRWVEELVVRYNQFGPSSLGDRRRGNGARPRILTPEILAVLQERVRTPPRQPCYPITRPCRPSRTASSMAAGLICDAMA